MTGPVSDNEPTALWSGPGGAPAHQLHAPERHTCNGCQASVCLLDLLLHACFTHIPTSEASLPFTVLLDQNVTATSQLSFSPLSQKHLECPDTPPHTYAASTTGGLSGPLLCPPSSAYLKTHVTGSHLLPMTPFFIPTLSQELSSCVSIPSLSLCFKHTRPRLSPTPGNLCPSGLPVAIQWSVLGPELVHPWPFSLLYRCSLPAVRLQCCCWTDGPLLSFSQTVS